MVGAYSTFVNKGIWTEPIFITRIEDKNGVILENFSPKTHEAMSEETANTMVRMLQEVVDGGTGSRLRSRYGFTNQMGGKTGTTQNQSDGWFIGITPKLVTGVWTGCDDRAAHFRTVLLGQGAHMALPVFGEYMKRVYADTAKSGILPVGFDIPIEINEKFDCGSSLQSKEDNEFD